MQTRMTKTARARGAKNALICGIGVLTVWFMFALAITFVTGKSLRQAASTAFLMLWGITMVCVVGAWLYGRKSGGQVVLDCGSFPNWKLCLLNAALLMLLNLPGTWSANYFLGVYAPIFGISCAIFWLILAMGRLQIREAGIWCYSGLLRWTKIDTYRWSDDSTLLLKTKGGWWSLNRRALPITPELRGPVEEILQKHFPSQPVA